MKFYVVALALFFAVIGTSALKCYTHCKGDDRCIKYNNKDFLVMECEEDQITCTTYKDLNDGFEITGCSNTKCESDPNYKCMDCDTDLCNKELFSDKEKNDD